MIRTILIILFIILFAMSSIVALPVLALVGKISPKKKISMSSAYVRGTFKVILFLAGAKYKVIYSIILLTAKSGWRT